nr:RNA polymerase-binding protein DksA [uncultured Acidovorax sp.]
MKAETSKSKGATKAAPAAAKSAATSAAPKAAAKAPGKAAAKAAVAAPAKVVLAQAPAAAPAQQADSQVPARTTRPSSRLAQLTVPSMAQAVASTAAKASYQHTMPTTVQAQPTYTAAKKDPKLANNWKTKSAAELTDAEVMAMPDSEYMNEKQMAFFRLKLVQLKQDIHNSAGETTEHLREDTVVVPDPADRATIEEEHALELRTRDRERKLLKKIEQSIARIDAGDYGYCDETGEPIGVGRLIARPTATLSLEAQQRRELKQKMFGD